MTDKKTLLIVDDHALFRDGLRAIIQGSPRYEVTGEAGSGKAALAAAKKLKPDLALVDISLPDQSGLELIGEIKRVSPRTKVMIVSMHSKIDYIAKAFQAGAKGYIVKDSASDKLLQGIDHVLKGDYFMDTSVSQEVVKRLMGLQTKEIKITNVAYEALTPREQEVMVLVAEGLSSIDISEKLFISVKTVENHRSSIMKKLDIHSVIEIVRYAAKLGLIDIDDWK